MNVAAHIFTRLMVHLAVHVKLSPKPDILASFIRHKRGRAVHLLHDNGAERLGGNVGNVIGAGTPAALNKGVNDLLALTAELVCLALAEVLVPFGAANEGCIGFYYLAEAAECIARERSHSFAQAV